MRCFVLALWLAGCQARSGPETLRIGRSVDGSLTQYDEQIGDGSLVDRYAVVVPAGQRLTLTAGSDQFEAFVAVAPESGAFVSGPVATGRQSGASAACVAVEATEDTPVSVAVSSSYGLEVGPYRLGATTDGPLPLGCRVYRLDTDTAASPTA